MKINIEVDLTPEELRRFMGLPDVQDFQQQMLERFAENLQNSQEQQEAFMRNLITNSITPWQNFFSMLGGVQSGNDSR